MSSPCTCPPAIVNLPSSQALALLCYLGSSTLLKGSYVLTFVLVTLLSAFDFWTVKNVSGRLLVGLRWWNHVDDSGESKWHFESHEVSLMR